MERMINKQLRLNSSNVCSTQLIILETLDESFQCLFVNFVWWYHTHSKIQNGTSTTTRSNVSSSIFCGGTTHTLRVSERYYTQHSWFCVSVKLKFDIKHRRWYEFVCRVSRYSLFLDIIRIFFYLFPPFKSLHLAVAISLWLSPFLLSLALFLSLSLSYLSLSLSQHSVSTSDFMYLQFSLYFPYVVLPCCVCLCCSSSLCF